MRKIKATPAPTIEEIQQARDNIVATYEAARASFQQSYTTKNKQWVIVISFAVVLALNANIIIMYRELAVDQVMSQAIAGKADKATPASVILITKTRTTRPTLLIHMLRTRIASRTR